MKRKGRKSQNKKEKNEEQENNESENGYTSDHQEPSSKKKKGSKKQNRLSIDEDDVQYEVQKILDEKVTNGVRYYLIRWKGYESESDTWEPESTLSCSTLINKFNSRNKHKKKNKESKQQSNKNTIVTEEVDENKNFEVERILDVYFRKNGSREFLVFWKGYSASDSTWEPEENMDCPELIEKFMKKVNKAKESEQRELRLNRKHTDRFTLSMGGKGRRLSKRNEGKQRIHYHEAE